LGAADEKKAVRTAADPAPRGVPASAVRTGPAEWRYTEAQGKTWIYRQTPFGITKAEETPAEKPAAAVKVPTKVVEQGDQLRFERPTPFGIQSWVRKKSELTEEEQRIWEEASGKKREAEKPAAEEQKK
jgi:hypothetical protein